jgi:hypothetical protein
MNESFELPVVFNNKEMLLPAQLHQYGYSFKIEVEVNGTAVFFERDEERNWRAMVEPSDVEMNSSLSKEVLQAILTSIEQVLQ